MELSFKLQLGLVCVTLLLPALCKSHSDEGTFTESRATFYRSRDGYGNSRGACGFGERGRKINNGIVTSVSGLWTGGSGCGACYQVKCKIPQYCDDDGAYVVVTDHSEEDDAEFIMSPRAFSKMGRNKAASAALLKYGVVDIEYKRVTCKYSGFNINIKFKVHESSRNPHYLAVMILNVDGTNDVTAVEMWKKDSHNWSPLRRAFGAVFDTASPPSGEINLRFQVSGSEGLNWVESKNAIPSNWKAGDAYDTEIQLN